MAAGHAPGARRIPLSRLHSGATGRCDHPARAGRVRLREGAVFGALGIAGSYAGSHLSAAVPANLLLTGFGVLMLAVAAAMLARQSRPGVTRDRRQASGMPGQPEESPARRAAGTARLHDGRHPLLVAAAATAVGLITGFFGVGGGFVIVPALVLILGFDMPAAAGTSLIVIAIDSAAALAARAGHGGLALDWALIGAFATGALAGGRLAGRASPQRLSAAFAALIVIVAGYTLARSLTGAA